MVFSKRNNSIVLVILTLLFLACKPDSNVNSSSLNKRAYFKYSDKSVDSTSQLSFYLVQDESIYLYIHDSIILNKLASSRLDDFWLNLQDTKIESDLYNQYFSRKILDKPLRIAVKNDSGVIVIDTINSKPLIYIGLKENLFKIIQKYQIELVEVNYYIEP